MKRNFIFSLFILLLQIQQVAFAAHNPSILIEDINLFDQSRNRTIPVLIYSNKQKISLSQQTPVVVINHGYTIKNSEYSFIANSLADRGYIVVSIQHDLKKDPELPKSGSLYQRRLPLWEKGVENIQFVLKELNRIKPNINIKKIILIGHSNGGDISMLFAKKYPQQVYKIISLDSLRMPFPKNKDFKILTLRANDTKADDGVLPKDQQNLKIILLKGVKHIDLCDRGSSSIKKEIVTDIVKFLNVK